MGFIRSIRMRYLSGLLIFGLTSAATMYAFNELNSLRRSLDSFAGGLEELAGDLDNSANFAERTSVAWNLGNREALNSAARRHVEQLGNEIAALEARVVQLVPRLSDETRLELFTASINGDLFHSARDIVKNLGKLSKAGSMTDWSYREIRNQNDLFAQPLLSRARAAITAERRLTGRQSDYVLAMASAALLLVLVGVAVWIFRPMELAMRRAFEESEASRMRAESADRAKSEFLANMSHEIRTPMNGVLGMAELLAKTNLDSRQKTFTEVIVRSGNALLTIINDILDFSKIDAGRLELDPAPFCFAEAIEDVATLMSAKVAEKDLELIVRVDPALPSHVVGDVGRIRQIVTNLIGNSVKFTEHGHVIVDVSGEVRGGIAHLKVRVEDTGIGIPADKLRTVFEKFAQVDGSSTRRHEGTGLGLAIASRLVQLMGGEMTVGSEVGKGSVFSFDLPLPVHDATPLIRPVPLDVSGARILVIDDNPVNREILLEQLNSWGFDCAAAESGPVGLAFLQRAAELSARVDCVVLDYQMPGMNGEQVARMMRSRPSGADIPIVLLTSVDQADFARLIIDHRISAHLTKPARSSQLLETLVAVMQKARSVDAELAPLRLAAMAATMRAVPRPSERHYPAAPAQMPQQLDILVAEDNEVNQLVFSQILDSMDLSYRIVGNGRKAVELNDSLSPRLILMDVSMPEMSGLEAAQAIRAREQKTGAHVPIIGVTAHALKGDRERCIDAGMDDYLTKPVSPDKLAQKIATWIGSSAGARRAG